LRAINLCQTGNREPDEDAVALKTVISRAIRPCILMQLAAALWSAPLGPDSLRLVI
jgi:hypothetical protein